MDSSASRASWQMLFSDRLGGRFSRDVRARVIHYAPVDEEDALRVISAAHVILDPFPVSTAILSTLQAFSLGVPIISMPSQRLGGRFVLALYQMMEYGFGNETVKAAKNGKVGKTVRVTKNRRDGEKNEGEREGEREMEKKGKIGGEVEGTSGEGEGSSFSTSLIG
jgi:hypothetical protein